MLTKNLQNVAKNRYRNKEIILLFICLVPRKLDKTKYKDIFFKRASIGICMNI